MTQINNYVGIEGCGSLWASSTFCLNSQDTLSRAYITWKSCSTSKTHLCAVARSTSGGASGRDRRAVAGALSLAETPFKASRPILKSLLGPLPPLSPVLGDRWLAGFVFPMDDIAANTRLMALL
jgi:hypothetical protein